LIWNKEQLPHQWKESLVQPIHGKGDKFDYKNYRGISLPSTSYKILSNIINSRLTPYADEITGEDQCEFQCNRLMNDQIFCIQQILEKKWDSVKRKLLCNILTEFGIPRKQTGIIS
jgi:hypothetical protein